MSLENTSTGLQQMPTGKDALRKVGKVVVHGVDVIKNAIHQHQTTFTPHLDPLETAGHMLDPKNKEQAKLSLVAGFVKKVEEEGEVLAKDAADAVEAVACVVGQSARRAAGFVEEKAREFLRR